MSELQTWVKGWVDIVILGVGGLAAILVPYWSWRKEARNYVAKRDAAGKAAPQAVSQAAAGGLIQGFVIDNALADRVCQALDRHTEALKRLCEETGDLRRTAKDLDHQIKHLSEHLDEHNKS